MPAHLPFGLLPLFLLYIVSRCRNHREIGVPPLPVLLNCCLPAFASIFIPIGSLCGWNVRVHLVFHRRPYFLESRLGEVT
ncbi:hypothetical protein C8J55DRAFT_495263 [Lentinula edodes]|uniref:Secreted peptide n=1 Tax=Lentinula lateritia TaxID=40482 RepID=A0A9W9B1G7_9AGAR|nr:hypothetical protein C8J55DRAFT_495263 [Lentinula edodes]